MTESLDTPTTDALVGEALALGEGLGRPLRYVQLNSFYNGSTGTIMRNLHKALEVRGVDSYILWGRRHEAVSDHERCVATKLGYLSHGALARLDDRAGFHSKRDTARLLKLLDEIDPDVVHLHNLHGYWVNVGMLFAWLAGHRCQVRWTLHDCWAFTGHCVYFTYVGCEQWRTGCARSEGCPQLDSYPKTICKRNCARNFEDKRRAFTSVPSERMTLITPSHWLEGLVKQSFLGGYPVEVRHNTVDKTVFKPTPSDFRERYGIGDRFMILGVASPWTERKGLGEFVRLARELDSKRFAIVLVGLSKKQIKKLRHKLVALPRTESAEDLAKAYTSANVFVHPGVEETFGMTVAEAEACGTATIVRKGSACEEAGRGSVLTVGPGFDSLSSAVVNLAGGGLVILITKTESPEQLAAVYTAADIFFNPTREDNFPTVNLEAEACGTPVVTYMTGGCPETLACPRSVVLQQKFGLRDGNYLRRSFRRMNADQ